MHPSMSFTRTLHVLTFPAVTVRYDATGQPMSLIDIRPMDMGDVMDGTIRVYRRNPWVFVSILAALIGIPTFFSQIANKYFIGIYTQVMTAANVQGWEPGVWKAFISPEALTAEGVMLLMGFVMFFLQPMASAVMVHAVSETILGRGVDFSRSFQAVKSKFGTIILAYFLYVLLILALLAPSIISVFAMIAQGKFYDIMPIFLVLFFLGSYLMFFFSIKFLFIPQSVVLDGTQAVGSLMRSYGLTSGYWWRTLGIYIFISFVVGIIVGLLGQTVTVLDLALRQVEQIPKYAVVSLGAAIDTALALFLNPIISIATTLMYYDLRIRKEGFDVILLASSLLGGASGREKQGEEVPIG